MDQIVITNVAAGADTFNAEDAIVPEPSPYVMVLLALAGLGAVVRLMRP